MNETPDCADQTCGDWSSEREYSLFLPAGHDPSHPYTLVFLGPGCGGTSTDIYSYSPSNGTVAGDDNADNTTIRGVLPNSVGLPDQPEFLPTCSDKPLAGLWVRETGDTTGAFQNVYEINRPISVNDCTMGTVYDNPAFENYSIGGGQADDLCRRILVCDPLYPLVVCAINGNGHGSHETVVNPVATTFLKSFLAPPLAAP